MAVTYNPYGATTATPEQGTADPTPVPKPPSYITQAEDAQTQAYLDMMRARQQYLNAKPPTKGGYLTNIRGANDMSGYYAWMQAQRANERVVNNWQIPKFKFNNNYFGYPGETGMAGDHGITSMPNQKPNKNNPWLWWRELRGWDARNRMANQAAEYARLNGIPFHEAYAIFNAQQSAAATALRYSGMANQYNTNKYGSYTTPTGSTPLTPAQLAANKKPVQYRAQTPAEITETVPGEMAYMKMYYADQLKKAQTLAGTGLTDYGGGGGGYGWGGWGGGGGSGNNARNWYNALMNWDI